MISVDRCGKLLPDIEDDEGVREIRDALYQLATICVDLYIEESAEGCGGEDEVGREDGSSPRQGQY